MPDLSAEFESWWAASYPNARPNPNAAAICVAFAEHVAGMAAQTPAETPLDLDALLSPKGAYEPGTGQEDGAQLLTDRHGGNPQWWAPSYGCDTLDTLLDCIRSRILPHLRPPIAGIDVPGPDGDYGGLQELCEAEGVDVRIGAPLLKRAREAWNAAQPPAPAPASDGERANVAEALMDEALWFEKGGRTSETMRRAATLLRHPAPAPAAVPVAVAERPWERQLGWLTPDDECWWCPKDGPVYWSMANPAMVYDGWLLPCWAIPIPHPPQGGEVG